MTTRAEHPFDSWGGPKAPEDEHVEIEIPGQELPEGDFDEADFDEAVRPEGEFDYAELLYEALGFRPGERVSCWDSTGDPFVGIVEHIFAPGGVPAFIRLREHPGSTITIPFEKGSWQREDVNQPKDRDA